MIFRFRKITWVMYGRATASGSAHCAICHWNLHSGIIPSTSTPAHPFTISSFLVEPNIKKPPKNPGGSKMHYSSLDILASTSWLSFGTTCRREFVPSHLERGLKPAQPGLSLGVFRRFGTMACFHAVASPNEVLMSGTLYYCINNASR